MRKKAYLTFFIILLTFSMSEVMIADEQAKNEVANDSEIDSNVIDEEENSIESSIGRNTVETNERRSVKMIVGGDSKGGVAKQVNVPVKE